MIKKNITFFNVKNMSEVWADIEGHPGFKISNFGRLQRDNGLIYSSDINDGTHKLANKKGHPICRIFFEGKSKTYHISCLVAKAFISNPNNYLFISHKDGNLMNNHVDNIKYSNTSHVLQKILLSPIDIVNDKFKNLTLQDGTEIKVYENGAIYSSQNMPIVNFVAHGSNEIKINAKTYLYRTLILQAYNFHPWNELYDPRKRKTGLIVIHKNGDLRDVRVENLEFKLYTAKNSTYCREINLFDVYGNLIKSYPSIAAAARDQGLNTSHLHQIARGVTNQPEDKHWEVNVAYPKKYGRFFKSGAKKISKYSVDGTLLEKYKSMTEASINNNITHTRVSVSCRAKANGKVKCYKDNAGNYCYFEYDE